ncbi:MFS transporter [Nonomuraea sp. NPDC049480]|uniref:MFS transporter n=1 Tax=Nonomuraea sp. NPDC049480 TaxID=3364353 RepID=UPI0037B2DA36
MLDADGPRDDLTGSPADLGIVVLSTRLPVILFTLVGGAIGDRFPRRAVMLVADLIRFGAHGASAALLLTGTAHIWMLMILQLVAGTGSALFNPAAVGLVATVAGGERLQAANSLISISRSAASMLALGAAGVLVTLVGAGCWRASAAGSRRFGGVPGWGSGRSTSRSSTCW